MNFRPRRSAFFSFLTAAVLLFLGARTPLRAATYMPLSDAELAKKSPVIVRAQVLSQELVHRPGGDNGADAAAHASDNHDAGGQDASHTAS